MTPTEVDLLGVLADDCPRCGRDLSTDCLCDEVCSHDDDLSCARCQS